MYPSPLVSHGFNYRSLQNLTQTNEVQQDMSTSNHKKKKTSKTEKSSKNPNSYTTRFANNPRAISRQTSLETVSTKQSTPLHISRSVGTLQDRIQRERRAHTMAPLTRISGPSATPKAKMFASIITPLAAQAFKSEHVAHEFSNTKSIYNIKSDIEMTTDDDTPIVVTVQYDPVTGLRPSETAVRQVLDRQLSQRTTPINKNEPIIVNFLKQNIQPQLPIRLQQQQRPSIRIPIHNQHQHNPFLPPRVPQPSRTVPSQPLVQRLPNLLLQNGSIRLMQAPKPLINRQLFQTVKMPRLPNRNIKSAWTSNFHPPGFNTFKPIKNGMADQQNLSKRPQTAPSATEMFRPPAVSDIPELSKDSLLQMLNQIPDLQGRQFNIEYVPSNAPDGYPIPLNLDNSGNAYPEPVVIDKLPSNIIQHVKSSNNPALTAALEATIQREQNVQSIGQSQANFSTLNPQPPMVMRHAAQPHQQVQQSRPVSSDDSDSSTEISSSETSSSSSSSSEETDSEDSESAPSYSEHQYR